MQSVYHDMNPHLYDFLIQLLSQPAAPFREGHVAALVALALKHNGIPFFEDPAGNIVVGAASQDDYVQLVQARDTEPLRVFIAHMDHPGFHGLRWVKPNVLRVNWLGGSPVQHLHNSRVWLSDGAGWRGAGMMRHARIHPQGYAVQQAEIYLQRATSTPWPAAKKLFGAFDFKKPVTRRGNLLYTRAADDLVGVFCILATALALFKQGRRKRRPPFLGLLTRAEEVGFVGAIAHFELGWLQAATRPVVCVSLEASRTLPGAEVGKGPIVRLGDRRTPFDANSLQVLTELAAELLPRAHQRRLMDGGTCEGTVAMAYGFPTIALAVPLGNYHNQGLQGGPECAAPLGPAPEFVHLNDVEGQRVLCLGLMRAGLAWREPWRKVREQLRAQYAAREYLL